MGPIDARDAPSARLQPALLGRLDDVDTPQEIAAEIVRIACTECTCKAAVVLWAFDGMRDPECEPRARIGLEDLALVRSAAAHGSTVYSLDGDRMAIRLNQAHPAVLLLTLANQDDGEQFLSTTSNWLGLVGRHFGRALALTEMHASLERLERSERLQHALFAIADLAGSEREMTAVLRGLHDIVGTLMYAENFIIMLYNAERDALRFLYFADVADPEPPDSTLEVPMASLERSLTWYLLRNGRPVMGNSAQLRAQVTGPLDIIGPESRDWLGVPMLRDGHARGAVVVQTYREDVHFSVEDRKLLEFVGSHILIALERKQGKEELEERVRVRTDELAAANRWLQREIAVRQRAERLQKALFQVAELATADISQAEFYHRVHVVVGELLNAENFFIALLSEDGASLEFPYYADATRQSQQSRPLGRGLSEYVLRRGQPLRGMSADIDALVEQGEVAPHRAAARAVCWLGQPLIFGDATIGLIAVQSYDATMVYGPGEQELLGFVATQIANSLHRRRAADALRSAYTKLEQRMQEST